MTRTIKFRAWDNTRNIMAKVITLQLGMWTKCTVMLESGETEVWEGKDIILMQFTGLLDKNGKEIYEGDIVHKDGSLSWIVQYINQGFDPLELGEKWEIIGDIYQNPELIK